MVFECDECGAQYVNVKTPKEVDALQARVRELESENATLREPNGAAQRIRFAKENARLREALEWCREQYWNRCYDGSGTVRALTLDEFNKQLDDVACVAYVRRMNGL